MSTESDDGHSPETCNYRRCGAVKANGPCPFVADEQPQVLSRATFTPDCIHDWRQYWTLAHQQGPEGFYCTKCLEKHD